MVNKRDRKKEISKEIRILASELGWQCVAHQRNIFLLSFKKEDMRVNIYYSKMTVGTCLNHPTSGRTQLFRKKVSLKQLERIFKNPRVHTHKGYYKKGE